MVDILIDASNGEIFRITLADPSITRVAGPILKDLPELLRISDKQFLSYSSEQKRDLVKKFSAVKYDLP